MIKPTFSALGVDLFLGDSATIVPELETVDLIATDPPYGVAFQSNWRPSEEKFDVMHGDRGEVDVAAILCASVLKLRRGRHLYVFGPPEPMRAIERLTGHTILIWDKKLVGMGDLSLPRGPSHEPINFAVTQLSKANRESGRGQLSARLRQGSVLHGERLNSVAVKRHPSEKPVSLMRQIIESSSCLQELVFDPFMGSGSTIVAALIEGRRAIGIEKDPEYFEIAAQRVRDVLPLLAALEGA